MRKTERERETKRDIFVEEKKRDMDIMNRNRDNEKKE